MTVKIKGISAVIIAKNEIEKITDCLKSVSWCEEVLVFDNNSTDQTAEVAKSLGAKVTSINNGDYSSRKNKAFSKCKNNWILSIDADERVGWKLRTEIVDIVRGRRTNNDYGAYAIPRRNIILGKEFKNSGQWPDYVIRLFRKDKFVSWQGDLHEQPRVNGNLGYLQNSLIHSKHDNLSEMVFKTNRWSEVEAKLMYDAKHPRMNIIRFTSAILREFYLRFILQKSFLDGSEGIIYALYQMFSRFLSYAKLWEKQGRLEI